MNQLEDNKPTEYLDFMGLQSIPKQDIPTVARRFEQKDCRIQSELSRTPYQEELKTSHTGQGQANLHTGNLIARVLPYPI